MHLRQIKSAHCSGFDYSARVKQAIRRVRHNTVIAQGSSSQIDPENPSSGSKENVTINFRRVKINYNHRKKEMLKE